MSGGGGLWSKKGLTSNYKTNSRDYVSRCWKYGGFLCNYTGGDGVYLMCSLYYMFLDVLGEDNSQQDHYTGSPAKDKNEAKVDVPLEVWDKIANGGIILEEIKRLVWMYLDLQVSLGGDPPDMEVAPDMLFPVMSMVSGCFHFE
ncbi:hypothetical protein BVC80_1165g3 [Macleaya cordata]|uniref:Uncharacterized protein n=1 Tax=Macleaya cordata TaxID=56857 RepID=A0A200QMB5_MACCD|nr:hypothetical protein BVC80_1165g3 [Macleaya cordata]